MGLVSHFREISPNTGWFSYNKNWKTQTVRNFLCLKGVIFISTSSKLYLYKNDCILSISLGNLCFVSSIGHFICLLVSYLRPHALTDCHQIHPDLRANVEISHKNSPPFIIIIMFIYISLIYWYLFKIIVWGWALVFVSHVLYKLCK